MRKKFYAHVIVDSKLKGLFEFGEQGRLKGPPQENSEISWILDNFLYLCDSLISRQSIFDYLRKDVPRLLIYTIYNLRN